MTDPERLDFLEKNKCDVATSPIVNWKVRLFIGGHNGATEYAWGGDTIREAIDRAAVGLAEVAESRRAKA